MKTESLSSGTSSGFIKCPFCSNTNIKRKWTGIYSGEILLCRNCGLGFDSRKRGFDYENKSSLVLDDNILRQYEKFARRITTILSNELEQYLSPVLRGGNLDVLEIGSGYGFMSDCITPRFTFKNYYHLELNHDLAGRLRKRNKQVLNSLDDIDKVDIIFMSHVLEHVQNAKDFLLDIMDRKLRSGGHLVLLQTDHRGLIPRYLSRVWYGWQLQEHYYHFTPQVFYTMAKSTSRFEIAFAKKYYLDQEFSFSLSGFVKVALKMINSVIPARQYDAFIMCLKKTA